MTSLDSKKVRDYASKFMNDALVVRGILKEK